MTATHFYAGTRAACGASLLGPHPFRCTAEAAEVTCPECQEAMAEEVSDAVECATHMPVDRDGKRAALCGAASSKFDWSDSALCPRCVEAFSRLIKEEKEGTW